MLKHPALEHVHFALNVKMTPLTERRQIPLRAICFIIVEVMYG
jgi:hypothetical protein